MFNWLKKLFGNAGDTAVAGLAYPPVTANGQDESVLAPYKVESPAAKKPATAKPVPAKKPAPKKAPVKKPAAGTRGRKPKTKPVVK